MEEQSIWLIALIFVLFVLVPLGYIWTGMKLIFKILKFRKNAVPVTGVVIEKREVSSEFQLNASSKYVPVFEFIGPDSQLHHGETGTASSRYDFALGSEQIILVDHQNPGTVQIIGDKVFFLPVAMMVIGGIILLGGSSYMLSLN